jgi:MtN3 and saliva related transmembrane protein
MGADIIGWAASAILLLTLVRQVYTQWRSEQAEGVSRWLFVGQITASLGFAIYSWLLQNWVFLFTNVALLVTALAGEAIYLRNRRRRPVPPDADISVLFQRS